MTSPNVGEWEDSPKSTGEWESVPSDVPSGTGPALIRQDRSRKGIGYGELMSATGTGALGGAFLPEILRYGGRAAQQTGLPLVSGLGGFAQAMAPFIGGTRATRAGAGGISGAASEAAGQAYEVFDEPGLGAEATRFAVGALPVSSLTTFLTGKAGQFIRSDQKRLLILVGPEKPLPSKKTRQLRLLEPRLLPKRLTVCLLEFDLV